MTEGTADQRKRLLIVDDNEKNLYMLEVLFQAVGYSVVSAKNGIEALERLRANHFDAIISDILMPGMDGFRLIWECKNDPSLSRIPFVFYTATYTEQKDEEFCLSLGAECYILKPLKSDELVRRIGQCIRDIRSPRTPTIDEDTFAREYSRRVGVKLEKRERALAESEEKYRLLYENSMDAILLTSPDGSVQSANPAACAMFQRTEDEIIRGGRGGVVDLSDPSLPAAITERERTGRFKGELTFIRKDGTRFPGEITSCVFTDRDGHTRTSMIIRDITERKKVEEQLKRFNEELELQVTERTSALNKSLHEKDLLVKEIHHRVKNNFQIVLSLLNLQSRQISDTKLLDIFRETQNRVKAMALVHERLYQSEDITSIDLSDYVKFMGNNLFKFYGTRLSVTQLEINISDIWVDINHAIPLGLLINELLSNALKYAFPEGRKGKISITGAKDESTIRIIVQDDGVGIPSSIDWKNSPSFGLRLVNSLVEQLQGTIELDRSAGTKYTLTIPALQM